MLKVIVGTVLALLFQLFLVSLLWVLHPLPGFIMLLLLLLNNAVILLGKQARGRYVASMRDLW